ncbi:hypothetical protein ADUPG1_012910 [Aduncisulcus paluster]|uniref:Uncharacterized protein n=1 Tax=Aduncisulcus paluster TaxID=2918883 RepID=A0ABQ5K135_9EUKA|nr:hypothetical protein ADUPG1_012910 [Aduncisulcus paluster]
MAFSQVSICITSGTWCTVASKDRDGAWSVVPFDTIEEALGVPRSRSFVLLIPLQWELLCHNATSSIALPLQDASMSLNSLLMFTIDILMERAVPSPRMVATPSTKISRQHEEQGFKALLDPFFSPAAELGENASPPILADLAPFPSYFLRSEDLASIIPSLISKNSAVYSFQFSLMNGSSLLAILNIHIAFALTILCASKYPSSKTFLFKMWKDLSQRGRCIKEEEEEQGMCSTRRDDTKTSSSSPRFPEFHMQEVWNLVCGGTKPQSTVMERSGG